MFSFTLYLDRQSREWFNRVNPYVGEYYIGFFVVELFPAFRPGIADINKQVAVDFVKETAYSYYEEEAERAEENGVEETIKLDCFIDAVDIAYDIAERLMKQYDIFGIASANGFHDPSFMLVNHDFDNHVLIVEVE